MKKKVTLVISMLLIPALLLGCSGTSGQSGTTSTSSQSDSYSHASDTEPDYAVVLPDDQVNQINITISPENWEAVQNDMIDKYGQAGSGDRSGGGQGGGNAPGGGGGQPGARPDGGNPPQMDGADTTQSTTQGGGNFNPQDDANRPQRNDDNMGGGGGMGGGMMDGDDDENPIWVDATITFNGETWEHVGFRLKGNSSLRSSWTSGNNKLPFKLDFDQFEDDYPATENQRFYGFKQLSFSSNFADSSYLREKVAADIFREAGVPSAQTAFYAVYVDTGDGPIYYGLYTAVEVVDDTLIQTQFEDDSGNVYKPSGSAATFTAGSYNEEGYDKETNKKADDYSDVEALLETLNSDLRLSDPSAWRAQLEPVFDVDDFLQWLAANTVMQNWDTYGSMSHNYYLYNDPTSGQLVWIPWDNNQSLGSSGGGARGNNNDNAGQQAGPGGATRPQDDANADQAQANPQANPNNNAGAARGGMGSGSTSIGNEDVGSNWPLISYLLADEVYQQRYVEAVQNFLTTAFDPDALENELTQLHEMIAPYVEAEQSGYTTLSNKDAFETSVDSLVEHIRSRYQAAQEYLEKTS
jgi:spore coat protein CotH